MKITKESRRTARECFHAGLTRGRLDPVRLGKLADALIEARPRGYGQILREMTRLVRLELNQRHATIESASALDEAGRTAITQDLFVRFGDDLTMEFQTDAALLGGLRVQVGSDVWDGTVINRLQQLKQKL